MSQRPDELLPDLENKPFPIQAATMTEPWKWTRSELLNGALQTVYCNVCSGTGLVEQRSSNAACPWCRGWIDLAYQSSGGIHSWQRYESTDLATFDWSRIDRQAADTVQGYAEELEQMIPNGMGMFIAGGTGAGKTHLAVGLGIVAIGMGYEVYAALLGEVLLEIRESWSEHYHGRVSEAQLIEKLCTIKLLILDDLGSEQPTDWAKERLAHIVNRRYVARLPTIVTTNLTIDDFETRWSSRVTSRLLGTAQLVELHDVKDYRRGASG